MDSTVAAPKDNSTMNKAEFFEKIGIGEQLRCAREAMQLTRKEVGARLHLNVNIITLIENENFAEGPPATFMRGYLRSYAKLLNFPENEMALVLKNLDKAIPSSDTLSITPIQPIKHHERYFPWLTYFILLVLAILVSVWWTSHSRYTNTMTQATPTPPPNVTEPAQQPTSHNDPARLMTPVNPGTLSSPAPKLALPVPPSAPAVQQPVTNKKQVISGMSIALPEPGNEQDENN